VSRIIMHVTPALAAVVIVAAACGSDPAAPDAMTVDAAACDPSAPFGPPVAVMGINSDLDDVSARFSPDERTVVFARARASGVFDMFTASRPSRLDAFATPSLLATVNSVNTDRWPSLSPDGRLLVFESNRSTNVLHIYVSQRASVEDVFEPPVATPALMDRDQQPLLANARALYFASPDNVRMGQGLSDIWRAEIDSTGAISTPTAVLGGVNSPADEVTPALTQDELRIFFRRTVAGEPDIYTASRTTAQDGFGPATPVPVAAVAGIDEVPNWVSPDGCSLYFHSNSGDNVDIFVTHRGG
jgi:Tol biopolymer transport system component